MYNNKDDSTNINRNTISRNVGHVDEEIFSNNGSDLDTVDGELFSELDHKEIYGRYSIENAATTYSTIGLPEFVSLDIDSASEEASNRIILELIYTVNCESILRDLNDSTMKNSSLS